MANLRFWSVSSLVLAITASVALHSGCIRNRERHYLGDAELRHYRDTATQIDYAMVDQATHDAVTFSEQPRTILDRSKDEVWDVSLQEVMHIALANNTILRTSKQYETSTGSDPLVANALQADSVYDPAIQDSGVLFGSRGVEAALADFDTTLTTRMIWGRDERIQNNVFTGGGLGVGNALVTETGTFASSLEKQFAYGGSFGLNHNWNYLGSNTPNQLFQSAYVGQLQAQYRHPLLAGAGTEYTRIAGPITSSFGGITGVTQGVTIARINTDITIAQFEANVRDMLRDVENTYWDLYLNYRNYDTAVTAKNSALRSWREAKFILEAGGREGFKPADEAQARDRLFETQAQVQDSLSLVYAAENELRRLIGLPVNDGRIIRPSDEPTTAQFVPDWYACLTDALMLRQELRRHKWSIKSLELQLIAARSLTQPRLDFVSAYQLNGFGDRLLSSSDAPQRSAYNSIANGDETGWNLGFEFTMPLGFRQAHAQVRNIELRLTKARAVLAAQELEVSHELANNFRLLAQNYMTAQSNFNRYLAAKKRVEYYDAEVIAGTQTLDLMLRAQASRALAEQEYYRSLVNYNKSINELHYLKGTLLEHNGVHLAESEWDPAAYQDALRRAWSRSHAIHADKVRAEPADFATNGPAGDVRISRPDAPLVEDEDLHPGLLDEPGNVPPAPIPEPDPFTMRTPRGPMHDNPGEDERESGFGNDAGERKAAALEEFDGHTNFGRR